MRRNAGIAAFLFEALIAASVARPCSCLPQPVRAHFADADAVFVGTPIRRRSDSADYYAFEFAVAEAWKGVQQHRVAVVTHKQDGMCGTNFEIGARYLVFATNRGSPDTRLWTHACSGTVSLVQAGEPLNEIGPAPVRFVERRTVSLAVLTATGAVGFLVGAFTGLYLSRLRTRAAENT